MYYRELGEVLREARTAAGVGIEDAARACEVNQSNLSKLERGLIENAPRKLDAIIAGYAQLSGVADHDLLARWGAAVAARQHSEAVAVD